VPITRYASHVKCVAIALLLCAACFDPLSPCKPAAPGDSLSCPTPNELDRAFDLEVPASWDGTSALPLIYAFHGGGGNRSAANAVTCPDGDNGDPACLGALARAAGYAVVRPDGTGNRPLRNLRTWNAGGGSGGWQCLGGAACKANVDDMAYFDKVHGIVEGLIPVDSSRVFSTGISNGGAISHRLACERPQRFAAIAAVGGTNQFTAAGGACPGGVAMLQLHGTEDPIWPYETSNGGIVETDKLMVGAEDSTNSWAERNGCTQETLSEALPDLADDGTTSTHIRWQGCDRPVELVRIDGGGHTWPQGFDYLGESIIGKVAQDFDGDDLILEFFGANPQ
jgi:polyhydroxybutyrate depolymerase